MEIGKIPDLERRYPLAAGEVHDAKGRKMAARRDAALLTVISLSAAVICVRFDLSEALLGWTRLHERFQLDELPAVLLVVAVCLVWFSARRYFEAQGQLALRRATERSLADALEENQRLAQQYLDMQERERKALARDLHDELGQYLNVIKLDAVLIRGTAPAGDQRVIDAARAVIANVDRVYGVVSNLIRQLRPVGFDELGISAALEYCINDWRARLPDTRITLSIENNVEPLDENRALTLFRLVQEALTNVARHSHSHRVDVRLARRQNSTAHPVVDVSVVDDGRGANLDLPRAGLGLVGMRERVAAFGGTLTLVSQPGEGFKVLASLPVGALELASRDDQ